MKKCPICTSGKISTEFTIDQWLESNKDTESPVHSFTKLVAENKGYGIEEIDLCDSCGFRFAFPYPDNNNLSKYYSEYYANTNYSRKK